MGATVEERLSRAIRNNNDLYEAVFTARALPFHANDSIWYCTEKTPPLYSNLVTRSAEWTPDDIFATIDRRYEEEKWKEWSIKDSFGTLELSSYGFTRLFDAQWIYLEAVRFMPAATKQGLRHEVLHREDALSAWRLAWDSDDALGEEIFDSKMLDDPAVRFIAGYRGATIVSGCLVNRTGGLLGISNFFSPAEAIDYWSDMVGFILDSIECSGITGYERNDLASGLHSLGFESTGGLTVWLKNRTS
jgi:hypothetical protein